jgi:hypothetical protein
MVGRLCFLGVLLCLLIAGSGCVIGVYSRQKYGPGPGTTAIMEGQTLAEVIQAAGAPDKVYESGETKILVYVKYQGVQYLGAYGNVKKDDVVILLKDDRVSGPPIIVSKGEAMTILGILPTPIMGPAITKDE